ncbi:MAG TPA: DUF92 domain-containing protein [Terriglobales bacterium]|nr:DUF92 domain-containing protein [Terriglobales bacterium]
MILKLALQLILGTVLSAIISFLAYRFKLLTSDGAAAAFLLGAIIFGTGWIGFAIPLLFFFLSSSLLSRYKSRIKSNYKDIFEKPGARDKNQVLANGIIAGILAFVNFVFPSPYVYYAYLACLATVNADTWGTEIGILSKSQPISLRGLKRVLPGSSGGISLMGTVSSLFGSFFLVLSGFLPGIAPVPFKSEIFLIIVIAGFLGSFIDSLLGAFLQAQYLCLICNKTTERKTHCNFDTKLLSGIPWLNNDWVNFLSSIYGIILFLVLKKVSGN